MTRLAIFDCDGTLVDSGATIADALNETFVLHGLPSLPRETSRRVIGLSLVEAMAALVPDAAGDDHHALAETYKGCFVRARAAGQVREPLYDGIADLLDELAADGWLLAVATGKSDRGLRHCLDGHGLQQRFISLQTADRHPSKPHPSMALAAIADAGVSADRSVVIGDTAFDMGMASAAGASGVGVAWGYHDADDLFAAGARSVASHPRDAFALISECVA